MHLETILQLFFSVSYFSLFLCTHIHIYTLYEILFFTYANNSNGTNSCRTNTKFHKDENASSVRKRSRGIKDHVQRHIFHFALPTTTLTAKPTLCERNWFNDTTVFSPTWNSKSENGLPAWNLFEFEIQFLECGLRKKWTRRKKENRRSVNSKTVFSILMPQSYMK